MKPMKAVPALPRKRYHHGDLRNALLETALRLVAERGAEGFSLREAAREVGVSPGAAYRHFSDKDTLLRALAAEGRGRLATAMERAAERAEGAPGSKERAVRTVVAIGQAYVEFAVRHPSHFRVMFGPCAESDEFVPDRAPSGREPYQILVDALDALVAAGVVSPEAREGGELVAWSSVHGLAHLLVDRALEIPGRRRGDAVSGSCRLLLVGMGCDPALLPVRPPPVDGDPRPETKRERASASSAPRAPAAAARRRSPGPRHFQ